ncbi:MAG: hypothetical protein ACE5II_07340, partial [Anaerolineae bacterium]
RFGRDPSSLYGPQLKELVAGGLLEVNGRGIRLTPRGRLLGNEVFERFLPKEQAKTASPRGRGPDL